MSINRTDALQIARRYASAAFALAVDAKKTAKLVEEINVLAAAMRDNKPLSDALSNPTLTYAQKAEILSALLKKADALTKRTIEVIARGGRADLIGVIAEQLSAMLALELGQVEATITSARALTPASQKQLASALAKATGKTVQLTLMNDPAVLGGVRIELGSLRLDATLAVALTTMRAQLLATTH